SFFPKISSFFQRKGAARNILSSSRVRARRRSRESAIISAKFFALRRRSKRHFKERLLLPALSRPSPSSGAGEKTPVRLGPRDLTTGRSSNKLQETIRRLRDSGDRPAGPILEAVSDF